MIWLLLIPIGIMLYCAYLAGKDVDSVETMTFELPSGEFRLVTPVLDINFDVETVTMEVEPAYGLVTTDVVDGVTFNGKAFVYLEFEAKPLFETFELSSWEIDDYSAMEDAVMQIGSQRVCAQEILDGPMDLMGLSKGRGWFRSNQKLRGTRDGVQAVKGSYNCGRKHRNVK